MTQLPIDSLVMLINGQFAVKVLVNKPSWKVTSSSMIIGSIDFYEIFIVIDKQQQTYDEEFIKVLSSKLSLGWIPTRMMRRV